MDRHRTVPASRPSMRGLASAWAALATAGLALGACGETRTGVCVGNPTIDLNGDAIAFEVAGTDTGDPSNSTLPHDDGGTSPSEDATTTTATSADSGTWSADSVSDTDADSDAGTGTATAGDVGTDADSADSASDTDDNGPDAPPPCPWQSWNDGLVGGRVAMVAFDPRDPGVAWASSGSSLNRSLDGGMSWDERSDDAPLTTLAFPPGDPKALVGGGPSGVFASSDNGRSLSRLALDGLSVGALLVHPASAQRVFVGTLGAGILCSNDGGANFSPCNVGVPRANILSFAGPPDDPDVALAGLTNQTDSLAPADEGALLRTTDGGLHWTTVTTEVSWGDRIAFCPSDSKRVVAAVRRGILASNDRGATWQKLAISGSLDVMDVAFAGTSCERLYASVYQHGVYRLDDNGATLTGPLVTGFDLELGRFQATLAAHPADPNVVLAATTAGLYRTADGGQHWQLMDVGRGMQASGIGATPGRAYLATWGSGLWSRTADAPWTRVRAVPRDFVQAALTDPDDPDRAAAGTIPDGWLTTSGVDGFATTGAATPNLQALAWLEDGTMLAGTQVAGVLRSSDGGAHWTPANSGLVASQTPAGLFIDVRAFAVDPTRAGRLYAALYQGGVAHSDDGGQTWVQPADTLRDEKVLRVLVDVSPTSGKAIVYALAGNKGVFRSDDDTASWRSDGRTLPTNDLSDMVLDTATHTLYLSAAGAPTYQSTDGLAFAPFDAYCQPTGATRGLAIFETDDGTRWLVAAGHEHVVVRHRL